MVEHADDSWLLTEVESLVVDQLQVVSYKWLSWKFSLSSNSAKRILQELATRKVQGIEVVYVVSGWSKAEPSCYFVQLMPLSKLEATKAALVGSPSIHVYSLQPSLPKDPAQLWSTDFMQAEELFNQPPDVNNCLRDNRFSAVSCSLVARNCKGKQIHVTPSGPVTESHSAFVTHQVESRSPSEPAPAAAVPIISEPIYTDKKEASVLPQNLHASEVPKKVLPAAAKTRTTGGLPQLQGGALKNLWGRATGKPPKPSISSPHPAQKHRPLSVVNDADAAICALESTEELNSDDDAANFSRLRRGRIKNDAGRKRCVIFDDEKSDSGDDEKLGVDTEDVISLASPEFPKGRSAAAIEPDKKTVDPKSRANNKKRNKLKESEQDVEISSVEIDNPRPGTSEYLQRSFLADDSDDQSFPTKAAPGHANSAIKTEAIEIHPPVSEKFGPGTVKVRDDQAPGSDPKSGSKKRKVLITRLDDRGREVTEVVWETDQTQGSHEASDHNSSLDHPQVKPQAHRSEETSNLKPSATLQKLPTNKTGSKDFKKAPGKAPQKGNLLCFFKKKD